MLISEDTEAKFIASPQFLTNASRRIPTTPGCIWTRLNKNLLFYYYSIWAGYGKEIRWTLSTFHKQEVVFPPPPSHRCFLFIFFPCRPAWFALFRVLWTLFYHKIDTGGFGSSRLYSRCSVKLAVQLGLNPHSLLVEDWNSPQLYGTLLYNKDPYSCTSFVL